MTERNEVYKCEVCGNIVEVLHAGGGELVCCGEPMKLVVENTVDAATEKHVPVIERDGKNVTVKIGEVPHPMTPEHYILFIEVIAGNDVYRHDFAEGDTVAEAKFIIDEGIELEARAYCNLHSFWSSPK